MTAKIFNETRRTRVKITYTTESVSKVGKNILFLHERQWENITMKSELVLLDFQIKKLKCI